MSVSVRVSDLWRGMASRKSHVSGLKNWMPMHSKTNKKKPSVGVELRAGEDPHRSEKPRWSACDMRQWPKQKKIADWFKANKMSFDLLKAVTMTIFILTCSKSENFF